MANEIQKNRLSSKYETRFQRSVALFLDVPNSFKTQSIGYAEGSLCTENYSSTHFISTDGQTTCHSKYRAMHMCWLHLRMGRAVKIDEHSRSPKVAKRPDLSPSLVRYLCTRYRLAHYFATLPENSALCQGCLLYTSPSPRDRQKSRMPSSA